MERHFCTQQLIKISLVRRWIIYYKNNAVVRFASRRILFCHSTQISQMHTSLSDSAVAVVVVLVFFVYFFLRARSSSRSTSINVSFSLLKTLSHLMWFLSREHYAMSLQIKIYHYVRSDCILF